MKDSPPNSVRMTFTLSFHHLTYMSLAEVFFLFFLWEKMIVKLASSVLLVSASLYCRSCGKLTQSRISFEKHPFHFKASLVAQKVKCLPTMWVDLGLIPGLGRSSGEGNGNPLQYSCLENPMDGWSLVGYSLWGHKESDMTGATQQQQQQNGTTNWFKVKKGVRQIVCCHPICLTYMLSTSWEVLGWMSYKLESR